MPSFARPTGARADLNELEYVSALHQTCKPRLRSDGTVSTKDVERFLKSRYGIVTSRKILLELMQGLGGPVAIDGAGATSNNDEPVDLDRIFLDLTQITTIITMPTIARAAHEWRLKQEKSLHATSENALSSRSGADDSSSIIKPESIHGGPSYDVLSSSHVNYDDEFEQYNFWKRSKKQQEEDASNNWRYSLRPMPKNMLRHVLRILVTPLVEDESRSGEKKFAKDENGDFLLTVEFIQALLRVQGEDDRAEDAALVESMLQLAEGSMVLNEETWVQLLTSDLGQWEVGSEDKTGTTEFFDVFQYESHYAAADVKEQETQAIDPASVYLKNGEQEHAGANDSQDEDCAGPTVGDKVNEGAIDKKGVKVIMNVKGVRRPINQIPMASYIDFAVDSQRSVSFVVAAWVFYVATSLTYISLLATHPALEGVCDVNFGCTILQRVWAWMILAVFLSLAGLIMLVPISMGNGGVSQSWRISLFSLCVIVAWTGSFYTLYRLVKDGGMGSDWGREQTGTEAFGAAATLCLIAGCILMAMQVKQFIGTLIPTERMRSSSMLQKLFIPSFVRGAARSKRAATRKVNRMLLNAFRLHPYQVNERISQSQRHQTATYESSGDSPRVLSTDNVVHSEEKDTMLNFVLREPDSEMCGGLLWTWRRIWNTELFADEGIWIMSRLYVIQAAQAFIALYLAFFFFAGIPFVADQAEEARDELEGILNLPKWVLDFVPTREQVYAAFYPAASIAMLVAVSILQNYIPSTVTTILKFRSGALPSLKDPLFFKYRKSPDTVYANVGNAVYAMLGTSILFFGLVSGFLFLCIWPFTRGLIKLIAAWGIGLVITILLKTILVVGCRSNFYQAFCRTRPLSANFAALMLECWHIGLGGGVLVGRFIQFLLASCFWVGRIDVPFLSNDVRFGGYHFDTVPTSYRKDILIHETHRHPFMLRLGSMYLMKLAHGERFSCPAGACWRNLFVVALMPWMKRYRAVKQADKDYDDFEVWVKEPSTNEIVQGSPEEPIEPSPPLGVTVLEHAEKLVAAVHDGVKVVLQTATNMMVDEWPDEDAKDEPSVKKTQ